jgi:hypothetical protein
MQLPNEAMALEICSFLLLPQGDAFGNDILSSNSAMVGT